MCPDVSAGPLEKQLHVEGGLAQLCDGRGPLPGSDGPGKQSCSGSRAPLESMCLRRARAENQGQSLEEPAAPDTGLSPAQRPEVRPESFRVCVCLHVCVCMSVCVSVSACLCLHVRERHWVREKERDQDRSARGEGGRRCRTRSAHPGGTASSGSELLFLPSRTRGSLSLGAPLTRVLP